MESPRVALVRQAFAAFAARDVDALREISDPDIEVVTVTGMVAGREEPYRGFEGLDAYIADVVAVWDEIELTPTEFHEVSGDRLLVIGRVRARRGPNLVDLPNAWLWEFRDEKVVSARVFGDPRGARLFLDAEAPDA